MAEQKLLVKRERDFHYPIYFENDFKNLARALKEEGLDGRKICIVTDSHVAPLYLDSVKTIFQEISSSVFSFEFEAVVRIIRGFRSRFAALVAVQMIPP